MTLTELLALMRGAQGEQLETLEGLYERWRVAEHPPLVLGPGEHRIRVICRAEVWWAGRQVPPPRVRLGRTLD